MTKLITDEKIKRLRELDKKASPVPWGVDTDGREVCSFSERYSGGPPFDIMSESFARGGADDDAALIAESRNALPMLLDSIARLKEALDLAVRLADETRLECVPLVRFHEQMARIRELVGEQ